MRPGPGHRLDPVAARPIVRADDDQDEVPVELGRWTRLATEVLVAEGAPDGSELSLVFVDSATMTELNRAHLGGHGPTDVLSFPLDDEPPPDPGIPRLLGDVVVCPRVAVRNAPGHAGTVEDEVALLVVHGILHVMGHDHASASERDEMWERERVLLGRFHGSLLRDPWHDEENDDDG